jgi:hypothetical protein
MGGSMIKKTLHTYIDLTKMDAKFMVGILFVYF